MENSNSTTVRSLITFFLLAFGFSWLFWLPAVLTSRGSLSVVLPNFAWVVIGAHGPLFAAGVLTYRAGGWKALRQLISSGFRLRMPAVWWLVILLLPGVLSGAAVWLNVVLNGYRPDTTLWSQPWMIAPTFLFLFFLGGSFQEEFGWRGYALPRLLRLWNPLLASLFLGVLWGAWHLPLFFISGVSQSFMPFSIFLLLTIAFSIFFTWFYRKTDRNLFSALLFHTAINTSLSVFPPVEQRAGGNQMAFTYLMIAFALAALLIVVVQLHFWKGREAT
jgi:membrane protease YdiL (CAAX protease family)